MNYYMLPAPHAAYDAVLAHFQSRFALNAAPGAQQLLFQAVYPKDIR